MAYYVFFIAIVMMFCYLDYSEKKRRFLQAKNLNKQFENWFNDDNVKRPSNAVFRELYKECYGKDKHPQPIYEGNRAIIKRETADVIMSFPTKHKQLVVTQLAILDNLNDYFEEQYSKTRTVGYFVNYIISLPLQLLRYLGIDDTKTSSKIFQIIVWLVSLFLSPIKKLILAFIDFLATRP